MFVEVNSLVNDRMHLMNGNLTIVHFAIVRYQSRSLAYIRYFMLRDLSIIYASRLLILIRPPTTLILH